MVFAQSSPSVTASKSATASISVSPTSSAPASASPSPSPSRSVGSNAACTTWGKNCTSCVLADNNCMFCPQRGCQTIKGNKSIPLSGNLTEAIEWFNDQCDLDCPTNPVNKPSNPLNAALRYCFLGENKFFVQECPVSGVSPAPIVRVSVYTALATVLATVGLVAFRP
eukprot:g44746.t1